MPEIIPISILIHVLNFLILLFFLNKIIYRPIRGILNKRKEEMDSSTSITDEWNRKIEKYSNEIEENIDHTRKEGLKERTGLRDKGIEAEKELLHDAYLQVEKVIGKAKKEIKAKVANAKVSLQNEMESFSLELAEKILGRTL